MKLFDVNVQNMLGTSWLIPNAESSSMKSEVDASTMSDRRVRVGVSSNCLRNVFSRLTCTERLHIDNFGCIYDVQASYVMQRALLGVYICVLWLAVNVVQTRHAMVTERVQT